jgi:hypothetical protein
MVTASKNNTNANTSTNANANNNTNANTNTNTNGNVNANTSSTNTNTYTNPNTSTNTSGNGNVNANTSMNDNKALFSNNTLYTDTQKNNDRLMLHFMNIAKYIENINDTDINTANLSIIDSLISNYDISEFNNKRLEFYKEYYKTMERDPRILKNVLKIYNYIKGLKKKEREILKNISQYLNTLLKDKTIVEEYLKDSNSKNKDSNEIVTKIIDLMRNKIDQNYVDLSSKNKTITGLADEIKKTLRSDEFMKFYEKTKQSKDTSKDTDETSDEQKFKDFLDFANKFVDAIPNSIKPDQLLDILKSSNQDISKISETIKEADAKERKEKMEQFEELKKIFDEEKISFENVLSVLKDPIHFKKQLALSSLKSSIDSLNSSTGGGSDGYEKKYLYPDNDENVKNVINSIKQGNFNKQEPEINEKNVRGQLMFDYDFDNVHDLNQNILDAGTGTNSNKNKDDNPIQNFIESYHNAHYYDGNEKFKKIKKAVQDLEDDQGDVIETLKISREDRLVFILATFFIRYITINLVQWCIDINFIKDFYEGFLLFAFIYNAFFWLIVMFVNINTLPPVTYINLKSNMGFLQSIFYYFYMGTNGIMRLLTHSVILIIILLIPVIININSKKDQKNDFLTHEEKRKLIKILSLLTIFIWIFTSIIAIKF